MQHLSFHAAMTLTEWSKSTLRRRLAEGVIRCADSSQAGGSKQTLICFGSIQHDICLPLEPEDIELLEQADAGETSAQTDLAALFLEYDKFKSAIYWLELAAKQQFADAMHLLGGCYLAGKGVIKDDHLALMWIAKAASLGHVLAQMQMQALMAR